MHVYVCIQMKMRCFITGREGGKEGEREGGREGGRERRRETRREGGKEGGREEGREGHSVFIVSDVCNVFAEHFDQLMLDYSTPH